MTHRPSLTRCRRAAGADADRRDAALRHVLSCQLTRDIWLSIRDRLEIGVQYRHEIPDNIHTGFVFLAWHFSSGRGYRDYWPDEMDFRRLRTWGIPPHHNNSMEEAGRAER